MHISIEKGKTLIIRLMAVGPVVEGRAQRDVWFEVNGEVCLYFLLNMTHLPLFKLISTQSKLTLMFSAFRFGQCRLKTRIQRSKRFRVKRLLRIPVP